MATVQLARKRERRSASIERFVPLTYLGVGVLVAALLFPTALRPPAQQPNQTAELSPDAPPDDSQTAIISSLNRSQSGVATDDGGEGDGGGVGTTPTTAPPAPPTTLVPRACPSGVGTPPRQVESVYSAPCAAPFNGDNGGDTSFGVTGSEIRIGVRGVGSRGQGNGDCNQNGKVNTMIESGTNLNAAVRHWYNLQQYFNRNFQLYGRQLVFYCVEPEDLSPTAEVNAAVNAVDSYKIFANPWAFSSACFEYARRKVISFCPSLEEKTYQQHDPYLWSSWFTGGESVDWAVEFMCKKLAGKTAAFAGEEYTSTNRKFGVIAWDDRGYGDAARDAKVKLKSACGQELFVLFIRPGAYWGGAANSDAEIAAAATKFKSEGVTTVYLALDTISALQFTNSADANSYNPEWLLTNAGALNTNANAGLLNANQMERAFGVNGWGPDIQRLNTECGRAYRTIDTTNDPNYAICKYIWVDLVLMISAIQQAGPNLNPQTFKQGLLSLGMRHWNHSSAQGGGFSPTRHSYQSDVAEVWWDPDATDPSGMTGLGAFRYLDNGRRYCHGQLDGDTSGLFKEGTTLPTDVYTVPDGPPSATCPAPP